jgi:hypothetical protein
VYELSTVSRCVGKTKALLAAKRSPVRKGSQMCLSVGWFSFSLSLCSKFFTVILSFYACAQRVGGMKSLGIADYFPVQLHQPLSVVESINNHLNPNVLYRVLCGVILFSSQCQHLINNFYPN